MTKPDNIILFSKKKEKASSKESRPCSFKTVSDKGNPLSGTAAFLVTAKRHGGIDKFIKSTATLAAEVALKEVLAPEENKKA